MNRQLLISSAAVLAALCFGGAASAQNSALEDLLGNYESLDAAVSPAGPATPVPAAEARAGDEFVYVDPGHIVPAKPLAAALRYYKANLAGIPNSGYLSVIDYTQNANNKRFYIINMRTGAVERFLAAHGKGSDPKHTGYATVFSNDDGTHATSLGFFRTGSAYDGQHGYSLKLHGLSSANSNALARAIVIHGAQYVNPSVVPLGRSWGCPAVELSVRTKLIDTLKGGTIIFAYHERFSRE
ncbi:MAG: murein L,D-transpeptidase catalytic domain family protein [Elusimicrobia bacterium]|nr:murein L,D-transpeptidase catalytic domain family protein [Elusimicrobiota bacterium]